ncbi:TPA: hypothetical protein MFN52_005685, partial [Klebsiella quasipneumoniae subsp. similipneumoniae]|nr:hypothetical protein [Klebsiella quasipneumoniae subsp. similipneumoniae]
MAEKPASGHERQDSRTRRRYSDINDIPCLKVELGVAAGCNQAATAGIRGLTLSGTKS